jgi:hypothetical protein
METALKNHENNILFTDNYKKYYERFGIFRDEMLAVMPSVMRCDVLSGLDELEYYDE